MKKNLFLFFLSGSLFFACSKKSDNFVIDIDLKNIGPQPAVAVLETRDKGITADTLMPNGNFFRIKGSSDSLSIVTFYLTNGHPPFRFYVKNGDRIEVKGDMADPSSVRLSGESVNQDVFHFRKQLAGRIKGLYPEGATFLIPPPGALPGNIRREVWEAAAGYVSEHRASPAATVVFLEYMLYSPFVRENDSLLQLLRPENRPFLLMEKIRRFQDAARAGSPGSDAPRFLLKNEKGKPVRSDTLVGKPVIVSFWSSEGKNEKSPENRHLQQLYTRYRDSVLWVNISLDPDSARWQARLKEDSLGGIQLRAPQSWNSNIVADYGVTGLPELFLLDKEGKIEKRHLTLQQLEKQLKTKFGNGNGGSPQQRRP